jgi:hypothetical protein
MNLRSGIRRVVLAVFVTAVVGTAGSAGAASLGGAKARTLLSFTVPVSLAATPTVLACDSFSLPAATGVNLDGRPVQPPSSCGSARWTVIAGNWTIDASGLRGNSGGASAIVNAGQTNVSAQATLVNLNGGGRVAGLAIDHSGSSRTFLAAVLNGGNQLLLQISVAGRATTLSTTTVTTTATTVLRVTRIGTTVYASVDGVLKATLALTPAQVTTLAGGTATGFYWSGGNTVRFSSLLVTTPFSP